MNRVEITWLDSCRTVHEWTPVDELKPEDLEPATCTSIGYLLRQDHRRIVLAGHRDPSEENLLQIMVIPRACVQTITVLQPDTTELTG